MRVTRDALPLATPMWMVIDNTYDILDRNETIY